MQCVTPITATRRSKRHLTLRVSPLRYLAHNTICKPPLALTDIDMLEVKMTARFYFRVAMLLSCLAFIQAKASLLDPPKRSSALTTQEEVLISDAVNPMTGEAVSI